METHWIFSGCDAADEMLVARYWDQRSLELEGKLKALSEEPGELHVAVHRDNDGDDDDRDNVSPAWEVQLALHLSGATLAVEDTGDQLEAVLDRAVCDLARQMDEHDEQPVSTAGPSAPPASEAVAGLLRRNHVKGRSDVFCALLEPCLRRLLPYLQHGLATRESQDGLPSEEITVDDVLDEALARAWDRFAQYDRAEGGSAPFSSPLQPLDQWLRQIALEVLQQFGRPLAERSLDEEVSEPADDADDPLRDAWTEPGGYPQTIELAELVAGHPGVDAWDRLGAEGGPLAELLDKLPRDQRQALLWHLTEGFSLAEIADFQGRSMGEVEEDIQRAQQARAARRRRSHVREAGGPAHVRAAQDARPALRRPGHGTKDNHE